VCLGSECLHVGAETMVSSSFAFIFLCLLKTTPTVLLNYRRKLVEPEDADAPAGCTVKM